MAFSESVWFVSCARWSVDDADDGVEDSVEDALGGAGAGAGAGAGVGARGRAGAGIGGRVGWDPGSSAYGAELDLFPAGVDPVTGRPIRIGGRAGRYLTIDALRNGLELRGYQLCGRSLDRLDRLRARVEARFGPVIVDAVRTGAGAAIDLVVPGPRRLTLRSDLHACADLEAWADLGTRWNADTGGDPGDGWPEDLIRALIRHVWSERWGPDEALFADGLVRMLNDREVTSFRVAAGDLCDWYLFEPTSDLVVE